MRKLPDVAFLFMLAVHAAAQHPSIGGYNVYYGSFHNPPTRTLLGLASWLRSRPSGVVFFNHPGQYTYTGLEFNGFNDTPSEQFVGMELFNQDYGYERYYYNDGYYSGHNNKTHFDEAITRCWKIGAGGGDDNHMGNWGTFDPFRLAILANSLSRGAILEALHQRRTFSTLDKNI